jgi:methanogenic corrinoid protein MtbC1
MSMTDSQTELSTLVAELHEEAVLNLVRQYLTDGVEPLVIIDLCNKGMIKIGEYYEQGRYYIAGLIMGGEIMRQVGQLVLPLLESKITNGNAGSIVLGTVEGDIHFIGKDIFKVLVRVYGFTIHDLGVDVPPNKFLAGIHEFKPNIVGLSCLISAAFKSMQETVAFIKRNIPPELAPLAYLIGGRVDELVCKEVGADYWTNDAIKGVRLCKKIMGESA